MRLETFQEEQLKIPQRSGGVLQLHDHVDDSVSRMEHLFLPRQKVRRWNREMFRATIDFLVLKGAA